MFLSPVQIDNKRLLVGNQGVNQKVTPYFLIANKIYVYFPPRG